jgi:DNA-binding transcriptional regulator YiaG
MQSDIAELRKKLNLKQTDLAKRLDVSSSTVQKWESGASPAPKATLELLQLLAGVHPEMAIAAKLPDKPVHLGRGRQLFAPSP